MYQQVKNQLNPNAQSFLTMWERAMEIAGAPHPADEALDVLNNCLVSFECQPTWNVRQIRFYVLLTEADLDAYYDLIGSYAYVSTPEYA